MKKRKTVSESYLQSAAEDNDFISKILTTGTEEEIERERRNFHRWFRGFKKRCEKDNKDD